MRQFLKKKRRKLHCFLILIAWWPMRLFETWSWCMEIFASAIVLEGEVELEDEDEAEEEDDLRVANCTFSVWPNAVLLPSLTSSAWIPSTVDCEDMDTLVAIPYLISSPSTVSKFDHWIQKMYKTILSLNFFTTIPPLNPNHIKNCRFTFKLKDRDMWMPNSYR